VRVKVDKAIRVSAAPSLLGQVFTNLIENAAHAAGKGGWLEVSAVVADGRVAVTVADSGPGVPVPMRAKIFEPFFTTKPQGVGTGLGLPVSREIIVRHSGALEVQDRESGSVFVVTLPLLSTVDVTAHVG
jgi:signal transduction histidine kinase